MDKHPIYIALEHVANATAALSNHTNPFEEEIEKAEEAEEKAFVVLVRHPSAIVISFGGVLMCALVIGNILHRSKVHWIPESLVVIFFGVILGLVLRFLYADQNEFTLQHDAVMNEDLLTHLFLPIIIFEAGWSLRNKEFVSQLPYILIFAVMGTIICMIVVAMLLLLTSQFHVVNSYRAAFTYGALIAAVDPVATLSTYAHLNVEPLLNILVMGESIINDAVAITLFEVLNGKGFSKLHGMRELVLHITLESCKLLGGSILLGLVGGVLLSWVVKLAGMRHSPPMAILYVIVSAYFIYEVATWLTLSGIITALFAGMVMSAFVTNHLSIEGSLLCAFMLKQLSSLADMAVFLFVGIAIAFSTNSGFKLGAFVMLFCLLGRATATFPLASVCNVIKAQAGKGLPPEKQLMITCKHMFMMWHAGLRGGIALVLCLSLDESWVDKEVKKRLIEATTFLICVFLFVFGGTTEMFLKRLGIPLGKPPPMFLQGTCFSHMLYSFHRKFLKPMLKDPKKDLHMHGSIMKNIIDEAKIKSEVERARTRLEEPESCRNMRFGLFGEQDPMHLDHHGWREGGGDDERWLRFYHHAAGVARDDSSSSDDAESSSESHSSHISRD